jgi:hypothetical protein
VAEKLPCLLLNTGGGGCAMLVAVRAQAVAVLLRPGLAAVRAAAAAAGHGVAGLQASVAGLDRGAGSWLGPRPA